MNCCKRFRACGGQILQFLNVFLVVCGVLLPENIIRTHVFLIIPFVTVWGSAARKTITQHLFL